MLLDLTIHQLINQLKNVLVTIHSNTPIHHSTIYHKNMLAIKDSIA